MTRRRLVSVLAAALALSWLGAARVAAQPESPVVQPEPPPESPAPRVYDPLEGMEPSGRIPKVPLPIDLPNPERWRYIPEGRIKPGNIFERHLVSSFFTPQVFFEQAVGAGGGVALTDIDFRGQRRQEFLGAFLSYTTEGQQNYRLVWRRWLYHQDLPEGGVLLAERSLPAAAGGSQKPLTRYASGSIPVPPLFHSGGHAYEENPPTDSLAFGAFVQDSAGDLAYYDLPSLGGVNTLRGYIANRFTDNSAW